VAAVRTHFFGLKRDQQSQLLWVAGAGYEGAREFAASALTAPGTRAHLAKILTEESIEGVVRLMAPAREKAADEDMRIAADKSLGLR
jgi:hypothetical protein